MMCVKYKGYYPKIKKIGYDVASDGEGNMLFQQKLN